MSKKSNKNAVFGDIISTLSKYFIAAVIIMVVIICLSGVRFIKSGNVALILRFGSLVGDTYEEQVHEPGLLLAFPYIIDEVVVVPTGSIIEQKITTHYTEGEMTELKNNGYVITGDQNIAVISATVKYSITDPVSYALQVSDIDSIVNACVSNAMVETAAETSVDDILTSGKEQYANSTIQRAQAKLDLAQTGITIKNLELTKASMPKEASAAYEAVNSASVQANTWLENARKERDTMIPLAEAEASDLISKAEGTYSQSISTANQNLVEFWGVLDEYVLNKELVTTRIYNEKISEILSKIGKVKIVQEGDSHIIIN